MQRRGGDVDRLYCRQFLALTHAHGVDAIGIRSRDENPRGPIAFLPGIAAWQFLAPHHVSGVRTQPERR